jgi:hypothetical protein
MFKKRLRTIVLGIILFTIISIKIVQGETSYPKPQLPINSSVGLNLANSMSLLSQNKREVRILFYGQSITRDQWWREVTREI